MPAPATASESRRHPQGGAGGCRGPAVAPPPRRRNPSSQPVAAAAVAAAAPPTPTAPATAWGVAAAWLVVLGILAEGKRPPTAEPPPPPQPGENTPAALQASHRRQNSHRGQLPVAAAGTPSNGRRPGGRRAQATRCHGGSTHGQRRRRQLGQRRRRRGAPGIPRGSCHRGTPPAPSQPPPTAHDTATATVDTPSRQPARGDGWHHRAPSHESRHQRPSPLTLPCRRHAPPPRRCRGRWCRSFWRQPRGQQGEYGQPPSNHARPSPPPLPIPIPPAAVDSRRSRVVCRPPRSPHRRGPTGSPPRRCRHSPPWRHRGGPHRPPSLSARGCRGRIAPPRAADSPLIAGATARPATAAAAKPVCAGRLAASHRRPAGRRCRPTAAERRGGDQQLAAPTGRLATV